VESVWISLPVIDLCIDEPYTFLTAVIVYDLIAYSFIADT
jgi:hypothetical protein